jgi:3-methyladenine DNA glycosylase Tag
VAAGFAAIRARAEQRKSGAAALAQLLPAIQGNAALAQTSDDRVLAEMTRRIFCSGFVWRVIEQKWPGFEAAFLGFSPERLIFEPDEFWEKLASDARIVRHGAKIAAVRENAAYVICIAKAHGSFGRFLAEWPADDEIGLLAALAKNGARLGGMTGQYFLRFIGWDSFILSRDVVAALRGAGVEISEKANSRRDLGAAQKTFTAWVKETGLSYTQLSRISAMSAGENYDSGTISSRTLGEQ